MTATTAKQKHTNLPSGVSVEGDRLFFKGVPVSELVLLPIRLLPCLTGLSTSTIRRDLSAKRLPKFNRYSVRRASLEAYLQEREASYMTPPRRGRKTNTRSRR